MIGIYKIENKVNGKCYIGQSINIKRRWEIHRSELKNNTHYNQYLQKAWNKYGENNFNFSIIEECDHNKLDEREMFWVKQYNSYANAVNSNGYNLTIGGDGFRQDTSVMQFDLLGNLINTYDSYEEASIATGISVQAITGCCFKHHKYAGRYIWIKKNDYINQDSLNWYYDNRKLKSVEQYDLSGKLVKIWESVGDIVKELGVSPYSCLIHNTYTCGGYIFKYLDDDSVVINDDYLYLANNSNKLSICKPFYQVDENGSIVNSYLSLQEAVDDGWNERMVNECCRGLRRKYKNYLWILQEEYACYSPKICNLLINEKPSTKPYMVEMYDLNNKLLKTYKQLKDVKQDGFLSGNVLDCCLGRKPQYKGYIWKKKLYD